MRNKLYWGLGILIVLLIGAFVFVMVKDQSKIRQLETDLAEAQKKREAHNKAANTPKVVDISDVKPPPAEPGFKWVRHGDHWDKIPVGQREKIVEPVKPPNTGPLTYHEELLETNPVEALRLQSEERGHWSAEHIPPFPSDDKEAADLARSLYLMHYYDSLGMIDTPIWSKAARAFLHQRNAIKSQFPVADPITARETDLWRLTWTNTNAGKIMPYGPMTRFGRARMFLSDYFPDFIDVPK